VCVLDVSFVLVAEFEAFLFGLHELVALFELVDTSCLVELVDRYVVAVLVE